MYKVKKTSKSNDPSRGLKDLPGAHKADKTKNSGQTIRVSGKYIKGSDYGMSQ